MYNILYARSSDFATSFDGFSGEAVVVFFDVICYSTRIKLVEPLSDVDSLDWKDLSAADITKRVTSKVQPGSIILFHNAAKHTPEALPGILENLIGQGYTLVPISELILPGNYTIDHTGRQCPA